MTWYPGRLFTQVPFVASFAWWLYTLGQLWIANGRLRLLPDVVVFALGAFTYGLFVSAAVTVLLAAPTYLLLVRSGRVSGVTASLAGASIGLAIGLSGWFFLREPLLLTPVKGMVVGLASGQYWLRVHRSRELRAVSELAT
jgi:hypothetical protein